MKFLNNIDIRFKLPAIFLTLILLSAGGTALFGYLGARSVVEATQTSKLAVTLDTHVAEILAWGQDIEDNLRLETSNQNLQTTMRVFAREWADTSDNPAEYFQDAYINRNPNPEGSRDQLIKGEDGSRYSVAHEKYHPYLRDLTISKGYEDLLLIDTDGNVVYSVSKEMNFSTNVNARNSGLSEAFQRASDTPINTATFVDFAPYELVDGSSVAFFSMPIVADNGQHIGVLVFQVSPTPISAILHSTDALLGNTGELILVGNDSFARSDSRFENIPGSLARKLDTPQADMALNGETGTLRSVNAEGVEVKALYTGFEFFGVKMAMLLEQSIDENAYIFVNLRDKLASILVSVALGVAAVGYFFSRTLTKPLNKIREAMTAVSNHDYEVRIPSCTRTDEIGEIASTLEKLRKKLIEAENFAEDATIKSGAFEAATPAMMMVDLDLQVTHANASTTKLFSKNAKCFAHMFPNFEASGIVGTNIDIFHRNPAQQRALLADPSKLPFSTDMNLGELKIGLNVNALYDQDGVHTGSVLEWEDVTEARLNSGIIAAINEQQATAEYSLDGVILNANPTFLSAYGYKLEELVGRNHGVLVDRETTAEGKDSTLWETVADGEIIAGKYRRISKTGSVLWMQASYSPVRDGNGRIFKIVEIATDITEIENVSFERMAELNAIGQAQSVVHLSPQGKILDANQNFVDLMGVNLEEILGKNHSMFVDADTAQSDEYADLWKTLARGDSCAGIYKRIPRQGSSIFFQTSFNPVRDRDGSVIKILKTAVDVTAAEVIKQKTESDRAKMLTQTNVVVDALNKGLRSLSDGDLTTVVHTEFSAEYEELRKNFNSAVTALCEAMSSLHSSAENIRGGANEIRHGAEDLSRRTEGQAATLEETAAALDELTASVKSAADGAEQANSVVSSARKDAESGGEVVRQAVDAMGEIEKSSEQISQIIGVIDDIAFQTNLLALNAGVEAARAGEAGRGFAVVASEVRALAQRSSDAAKEIKTLILTSSQQVDRGVDLVGQAGVALKDIIESVATSNSLVSDIASSAKEQAIGLAEINTGVNQLDHVTQQNAAMVEETTAASLTMHNESTELANLVSKFVIERTDSVTSTEEKSINTNLSEIEFSPSNLNGSFPKQAPAAANTQDWQDF